MKSKKIIIIAGGSGGHVFPGLTIARDLIKKGWNVNWIGVKNKIEANIIPQNKIKIHFIDIMGLRQSNIKTLILSPIYILNAYFKVKKIIKNFSPDIVLGMGGYVSGPAGLAAWRSKIPLLIHEQNKISGITNRILANISTKNIQAFSGSLNNAEIVGNPIREEIIKIPPPIHRFKNRNGPLRILIIGGSQGASILNEILPKVLYLLKERITIYHQTGHFELEKTRKKYKKFGLYKYKITSFIKNIASAYSWADIIICRSGALTVSEIAVVGLGAIFIPYPHKDNQQYLNAQILQKKGAAKIIPESELSEKLIVKMLYSLNREILKKMAQKAYLLGIRNATLKISNIIHKITKN